MNNFNMSSTGVNIEVNCSYNSDIGQCEFNENFERIKDNLFLYVNYGNIDYKNIDILEIDYKKATCKKMIDIIEEYDLNDYTPYTISNIRKFRKGGIYDFLVEQIECFNYTFKEKFEMLTHRDILKHKITFISVRGYSQGDYAEVIILEDELEKIWGVDKIEEAELKKDFEHLFYDAPVSGNIMINDQEFYIDEMLDDRYEYDNEEILTYMSKNISTLEFEELKKVVPDTIDYV